MTKSFLELHKKLTIEGLKNNNGLCSEYFDDTQLKYHPVFKMVRPENDEKRDHEFVDGYCMTYWGYGEPNKEDHHNWRVAVRYRNARNKKYSPLRQNLILLCAALNNEL